MAVIRFLALQGLEDGRATNAGLMDQQSALRWVKREAGTFGGDPTSILIFGQSAGGGSVLTQMLLPASKGLFTAAVIESGGPFNHDLGFAQAHAAAVAERAGCGGWANGNETM